MQLSEQEIIRRQSKEELEKLGINPYPAELFDVNASAKEILENYERQKSDYRQISIAGRIMSRRIMGNASFAELQDETGRIQIAPVKTKRCIILSSERIWTLVISSV
jgi:lysyl-tRNA synthetase, class II